MIEKFKILVDNFLLDTHLRIALADVDFSFPPDCKYPNLSVRIEGFGLINPLEGRTVATLPEIRLAKYLGAEIIYHEAIVLVDYDLPIDITEDREEKSYVFRTHLRNLFNLRSTAKKNNQELLQQLYKTYSNSIYGKVAQGIAPKSSYNTREGGTKKLPKSSITNSYYASMITGLIRAALSELLVAIDELINEGYNYKIISATTDGLIYGVDENVLKIEDVLDTVNESYTYSTVYEALSNNYKKFKPFEVVDPILTKKIKDFPSLQLLKLSHEAWDDFEYIEIKHIANRILNFKTRGQVGFYKDNLNSVCTILAKAGHKIAGTPDEQAEWIIKHFNDTKIEDYTFSTLASIKDILNEESPIEDIVSLPQKRIISLDYDFKRAPINGCDTAPHKDINQFMKYRQSAEYLKRFKQRATVDAVDYKFQRAKQNVRLTGSNKAFCVRHILRGLVHKIKPFGDIGMTYNAIASALREFITPPIN